MGCFWSSDAEKCLGCRRRAVNNLVVIDQLCEICRSQLSRTLQPASARPPRPLYGEYRCSSCGRFWSSRLSWLNYYQICYRCRKHVFAHNQRELRPSDSTNAKESVQEHQKNLCQMCQQLGYYCGNFGQRKQNQRKMY